MTHRFSKGVADYAPGALWLVKQRISEHKEQFGGRLPRQLLMHGPSFRALIEEDAQTTGLDLSMLPPIEMLGGCRLLALDSVPVFQCPCGRPFARDELIRCDGTIEEI